MPSHLDKGYCMGLNRMAAQTQELLPLCYTSRSETCKLWMFITMMNPGYADRTELQTSQVANATSCASMRALVLRAVLERQRQVACTWSSEQD